MMHAARPIRDRRPWPNARLVGAGLMLVPAAAFPVGAQVILGGEGRVAIDTNPLLLSGKKNDAIITEITANPEFKTESATGNTLDLAGVLIGRHYSRRYDDYVLGSVRATGTLRDSERLSVTASASYLRDLAGDAVATNIDGLIAPQTVRNVWQGDATATWRPNARTMIVPTGSFEHASYEDSPLLQNTNSGRVEVALLHKTTAHTWVGVRPVLTTSQGGGQPSLIRSAVFATIKQTLTAFWTFSADAGVEHVDGTRPVPGFASAGRQRTAPSGSLDVCRTTERTNACLTASLGSDVSALFGFQRRKAVGARVTRQLDERRTVTAAVDYQRFTAPEGLLRARELDAASARLDLEWRLNRTLTLAGELQYRRRAIGIGETPEAGYAGIRLRLRPRLP